ncbi:hypothetical protein INS49_004572 [Diaporthe citri]|uniref:uncharacterized protein n=1 Tax=Diaporthe citri TaxID=83186 RepID=UPI001C7FDA0C|nr:uncharacterized protein INS49_004572 [Diaporthe citri]KAG6354555.1 hypothetical protein INS49_004572 [Diaporthe citri]
MACELECVFEADFDTTSENHATLLDSTKDLALRSMGDLNNTFKLVVKDLRPPGAYGIQQERWTQHQGIEPHRKAQACFCLQPTHHVGT